jgi:hypothetical protein
VQAAAGIVDEDVEAFALPAGQQWRTCRAKPGKALLSATSSCNAAALRPSASISATVSAPRLRSAGK